jgi:hypothetical protein
MHAQRAESNQKIGEVDPNDTLALNEIDRHVLVYVHRLRTVRVPPDYHGQNECEVYKPIGGLSKDYVWPNIGKLDKFWFFNSPQLLPQSVPPSDTRPAEMKELGQTGFR